MTDGGLTHLLYDVVVGYVIDRARTLAAGHDALFGRALRLYALIESEVTADKADARARVESLLESPIARGLTTLLPRRTASLIATAVTAMTDNRRVMTRLEARVVATAATERSAIEDLYQEVLVSEIPHQRSLNNLNTIAEACQQLHDLLTSSGLVSRTLRSQGWSMIRSTLLKDPAVRTEADALWNALKSEPHELLELANAIRAHGPKVLNAIYAAP